MRDLFIEVWESIRRNKIRTCLTGFAVVWGLFMLIVLLGGGNGLMNAFMGDSQSLDVELMTVYGNITTKPYAGFKQGRNIYLDEKDLKTTENQSFQDVITDVLPMVSTRKDIILTKHKCSTGIMGVTPEAKELNGIKIVYGRFLNKNDIDKRSKVVVLPDNASNYLTDKASDFPSLIGKSVKISGINFKVIGIYKANFDLQVGNAYCPYPVVKYLWRNDKYIDRISFKFQGLNTVAEHEAFEAEYKRAINANHNAAPDDNGAIYINNQFTQAQQVNKAKNMLRNALWIVGILTLLSGIVGIGNIMLITVKERTHEFGIRKALGAKPWSITQLIITESVLITAFFGYIGMVLGMAACELLDKMFGSKPVTLFGVSQAVFKDPGVGLDIAIEATILLIIAGTIAGLIPALKAAKVKPIEALRAD